MSKFSLINRIHSIKYAIQGIRTLLIEEHNARIHLTAAIVSVFLGFILDICSADWLWIALAIALVFISELLNSAIESLADLQCSTPDPYIKKAKDYGAAAVLFSAFFAVAVGLIVFVKPLYLLMGLD